MRTSRLSRAPHSCLSAPSAPSLWGTGLSCPPRPRSTPRPASQVSHPHPAPCSLPGAGSLFFFFGETALEMSAEHASSVSARPLPPVPHGPMEWLCGDGGVLGAPEVDWLLSLALQVCQDDRGEHARRASKDGSTSSLSPLLLSCQSQAFPFLLWKRLL